MNFSENDKKGQELILSAEYLVGRKLRELRNKKGLSLRTLADQSGLNVNTLSLIENGKSSPSVSTLQNLALSLNVSISTFFDSERNEKRIVYTSANQRPVVAFGSTQMQNLGKNLFGNSVQPFVITLKPGMGSGDQAIVHTGHEFVYSLSGTVHYHIETQEYILSRGDSLLFEAHLPHRWENISEHMAEFLLVFYPSDSRDEPEGHHFSIKTLKKELTMKIATITEDGKTISQHFGRAPYYLVLTIEEGKIVEREMREKIGHNHFKSQSHGEHDHGADHGNDAGSHMKHSSMAEAIADCKVVICGGMGRGAYESMQQLNIQPIVTVIRDIETATQAFLDGKLIDHIELLH